jgi:hypothetical protein
VSTIYTGRTNISIPSLQKYGGEADYLYGPQGKLKLISQRIFSGYYLVQMKHPHPKPPRLYAYGLTAADASRRMRC